MPEPIVGTERRDNARGAKVAVGLLRYAIVAALAAVVATAASALTDSQPFAEAIVRALLTLLWVGGIAIVAGLPVATVFLVALYYVIPRYHRPSRVLTVGLSALVWAALPVVAYVFLVVTQQASPLEPFTTPSSLGSVVGFALVGSFFGVFEAISIRASAGHRSTPLQPPSRDIPAR